MVAAAYIASKWLPGGHNSMIGIVNTYVHSVMYVYYLFAAFKPVVKRSIKWKKLLTQIQIAQFLFLTIHFLRALIASDCEFPKTFLAFAFGQNVFMLCLFGDFYRKVYL